ncbi:hypothetical protein EE612_004797, partial [Oryza sativa]
VVQRAATVLEDIHLNKHIRRMVWEKLAAKDTRSIPDSAGEGELVGDTGRNRSRRQW